MARVCEVCGKKPTSGHSRTFSNKAVKRWFKPNILNKNIDLGDGIKIRVKVCSKCYKKLVQEWQI